MAIEIVELYPLKMVDLSIIMLVYQRVPEKYDKLAKTIWDSGCNRYIPKS